VHELGERVDLLAVDEDVDLDEVARAQVEQVVVERAVALRQRLQAVVEVEEHLGERQLGGELDAPLAR
jgi:hypothetical protein